MGGDREHSRKAQTHKHTQTHTHTEENRGGELPGADGDNELRKKYDVSNQQNQEGFYLLKLREVSCLFLHKNIYFLLG